MSFIRLKTTEDFAILCDGIAENDRVIFYLSIPPAGYVKTVQNIGRGCPKIDVRVVLEKPFGTDETSALELFHSLSGILPYESIYLVDHYKGLPFFLGLN